MNADRLIVVYVIGVAVKWVAVLIVLTLLILYR